MNKRIFKPIMSLVLVVVMAVSTMMVSAVPTLAATGNAEYKFDIQTAGSDGKSKDAISIKVNGENGSTSWHNVGKVAKEKKGNCSFSDINIGTIKSITVKNNGSDGWYPEIIKYTKQNGGERFTTTLYGGRWVDDGKEVTISVTDRAAKVTVQTSNLVNSGTDGDVCIKLVDEKGNSTGDVNLSSIHPNFDAFEIYDRATFYIHVPENFGELKEIDVHLTNIIAFWILAYIDVTLDGETKIFPCNGLVTDKLTTLKTTGYLYKVTVKTSDKILAGTDNKVRLHAYDENGKPITHKNTLGKDKDYYELDNGADHFERNATEVFYIASPKKIADIKMECEDILGTDWHLDYVQLDLIDGDNVVGSTKYNYNQWIKAYGILVERDKGIYAPKSKEVLL